MNYQHSRGYPSRLRDDGSVWPRRPSHLPLLIALAVIVAVSWAVV